MKRATAVTQPPGTSWKGFVGGGSEGLSCCWPTGSVRFLNTTTGARVLQRSSGAAPLPFPSSSSLSLSRRGFHKRHSPSPFWLDRNHQRWQNVVMLPPFHHRNQQDTKSDASPPRFFMAKRGLSFFGAKRQEEDMVNPHGEVLVYQSPPAGIARVVWVGLCAQTGLAIAFAPYFVLSHLDQMALWGGVSGGMLAFSLLSLSLVRYAFKRKVSSIHAPASLLASSPASTPTSAGESNNEEGPLVRVTRWQHPFKQREELVPAKELQERCYLAVDGTLYVTYPDYRQLRYIVQRDGFIHNADLFAKIFPVAAQAAASALNADYAQTSAEFDKATIPSSADAAAASAAPPSPPASSTTTAASTTQSSPSGGARKTHHKGNRQK